MPATRKRSNGRPGNRFGKDAISLLKDDHTKVRRLFKRLEASAERGSGEEILNEIENELKVHTQIEEEIFYPAFKEAVEGKKAEHLYFEAIEEHHVVDLVLPEVKSATEGSDEFAAKGKVLKDIVEHHAEEEETQMFPKARRAMNAAQLRELGERLQQRKQELMDSSVGRNMQTGRDVISRLLQPIAGGARGNKTEAGAKPRRRAA